MIYENSFVYGRELVKKLLVLAIATAIATLLMRSNPSVQLVLTIVTIVLFVVVFVTIYKNCRCSHCGKVIFFGVLAVTSCPRCKRNLITGKKVKKSKR